MEEARVEVGREIGAITIIHVRNKSVFLEDHRCD